MGFHLLTFVNDLKEGKQNDMTTIGGTEMAKNSST